ncbi:PREDICTED: transmembrane protein 43 homolog [Ceratosolen solmsi marchali]|uniref:Transmembrane protein 43 homolog n=1 Tax=Ceratosolen solmsi marchali TaxID=326594 RepID=A0AAJ7E298_9HYME|nr:PREDICTED: transmembrane protein 43 homolog [Ceratosolen solmsi marchali]
MHRSNQYNGHRNNTDPAMFNSNANHQYRYYRQRQETHSVSRIIIDQFKRTWLTTIIGLILLIVGICLFVWNEGKAVKIAYSLQEALNNVAEIQNTFKSVPELEGRLVYLSGTLNVAEPLTEPDYGVMVSCIKLKRRVQIYQWIEIEEERSYVGSTEPEKHYYYTTEWKDKLIDSDNFYITFGHENPTEISIQSVIQISEEVKIGIFALGMELKKKFNDFIEITSDERPERPDIKMHSGLYYHSSDLWDPKVGDVRVQLSYAGKAGDTYTVIGKLVNGVIEPYKTMQGEEILLQRKYTVSIDQMFHLEHVDNYWRTWTMRGLGWLVMFLSATCLASILKIIIQNSNFLSEIINIEYLTMSVSMSTSLLVIGFAWVWYRPIIGLVLALASIFPFMYSTIGLALSFTTPAQQQRDNYRRL